MPFVHETGRSADFRCALCGTLVLHHEVSVSKKGVESLTWGAEAHNRPDGIPCPKTKKGFWTLVQELAPNDPDEQTDWTATAERIAQAVSLEGGLPYAPSLVTQIFESGAPRPSDFPWTITPAENGFRFTRIRSSAVR